MPITANILKKYLNPVFIETGSGLGDGIQSALDAGFRNIWSIESSKESFLHCCQRFEFEDKVGLLHCDTVEGIYRLSERHNFRCTFWLDAHNEGDYPVLRELDEIAHCPIKTHTILIDDIRMFPEDKNGLTVDQIKAKILEINPNYEFSYENGHVENDILVAKIK